MQRWNVARGLAARGPRASREQTAEARADGTSSDSDFLRSGPAHKLVVTPTLPQPWSTQVRYQLQVTKSRVGS